MTKENAERFEADYNHWASSEFQLNLALSSAEPQPQPLFYNTLLVFREDIIAAVKASVK